MRESGGVLEIEIVLGDFPVRKIVLGDFLEIKIVLGAECSVSPGCLRDSRGQGGMFLNSKSLSGVFS